MGFALSNEQISIYLETVNSQKMMSKFRAYQRYVLSPLLAPIENLKEDENQSTETRISY